MRRPAEVEIGPTAPEMRMRGENVSCSGVPPKGDRAMAIGNRKLGDALGARMGRAGAFALLLCFSLVRDALAVESTTFSVERMAGDGWVLQDLQVEIPIASGPGQRRPAHLTAASMTLAGLPEPLRTVRIECPDFTLEARRVRCADARVDAVVPTLGRQRFRASLTYELGSGALDVQADGLRVGDGTARVQASLRDGTWSAGTQLGNVRIDALLALARQWSVPLPAITGTGSVTLDLRATGSGKAVRSIGFDAAVAELTAGNEAGTLASDKLALTMAGRLSRRSDRWEFTFDARSSRGQAYAEPVFLDFGVHAIEASGTGAWLDGGGIDLATFKVEHRDVVTARGSASLAPGTDALVRQLDVVIDRLAFPGAFASYLQPFLISTDFKDLETAGTVAGHLVMEGGSTRLADFSIDSVSADTGTGKLALYGLEGEVHWRGGEATGEMRDSRLTLEGGLLFGLDVGATTLAFRTANRDFELLQATRIPLLDGALELDRFAIRNAGLPEMAFALDANLVPLSLQRLSRAFGWPEFGGQLGGRISDLKLQDGVLTLSTTLEARVFDGRLEVSDLRLEDPFGDWPRLYSSIGIFNLDLEQVTSAFSFGRITGRLSGYVNELVLFNWMPVEFDARLYTPPDDRSRHRISQRAVQNIGNLGGGGAGVGAALSSGFMRFFEEFNYAKLGISCRLENEVCLMDGVDPAPKGGYYLVKGRGLPRINVIGNAPQVDWPRLVAQIRAIMQSSGPVVR